MRLRSQLDREGSVHGRNEPGFAPLVAAFIDLSPTADFYFLYLVRITGNALIVGALLVVLAVGSCDVSGILCFS